MAVFSPSLKVLITLVISAADHLAAARSHSPAVNPLINLSARGQSIRTRQDNFICLDRPVRFGSGPPLYRSRGRLVLTNSNKGVNTSHSAEGRALSHLQRTLSVSIKQTGI